MKVSTYNIWLQKSQTPNGRYRIWAAIELAVDIDNDSIPSEKIYMGTIPAAAWWVTHLETPGTAAIPEPLTFLGLITTPHHPDAFRRVFSQVHSCSQSTASSQHTQRRCDEMPERPPFAPRPAQPPGPTVLKYSPDGSRLNVAGCGNFARSYRTNDNGEPDMLMDTHEDTLAIASGNDFVVLGCEDGTVTEYKIPSGDVERMIVRFTLPVRDLALLKDGQWVAATSE